MNLLKNFSFVFFILIANNLFSQTIKQGDIIRLENNVPIIGSPTALFSNNVNLTKKAEYLQPYVKFRVIKITDTQVKLIALNYTVVSDSTKIKARIKYPNKIYKDEIYNNKIYTISRNNFNSFSEKIEPKERFSIGLLTLPFKARPQGDVTFDTEFNLNSTLNIRLFDIAGSSLNYQIGAGIGSVGLNTSNASGLSDDEAQDVATMTLLNGLMLQYKRVQVGLYAGVDHINNQKNYKWESNGNIWFGFGIGYNLFDISLSGEKNKQ
jgi:hypothetical protein